MLTFEDALNATEFHADGCSRKVGPRGGVTESIERWRRNGRTRTWKTRPGAFEVPVKFGLYAYGTLRPETPAHAAGACPLLTAEGTVNA